jgi:sensor domain CHASE-containing protein
MRLKTRSIIITNTAIIIIFLIAYLLSYKTISENSRILEEKENANNLNRTYEAFNLRTENLDTVTQDWSYWDDLHAYALGKDPSFASIYITFTQLSNLKLDYLAIIANNNTLQSYQVDYPDEELLLSSSFDQEISNINLTEARSGIIRSGDRFMMISAKPITTSDGTGIPSGILVFGRNLDDKEATNYGSLLHMDVAFLPYDPSLLPDSAYLATAENATAIKETDTTTTTTTTTTTYYLIIKDIQGKDSLMLAATTTRDYFQTAKAGINILITSIIILTILVLIMNNLLIYLFFKKINLQILLLTETTKKIISGDYSTKYSTILHDEIGELSGKLEEMRLQLKKYKEETEQTNIDLEGKIRQRTKDLEEKQKELEKFNKFLIGRELFMAELKKRNNELEQALKQAGGKR